MTLRQRLTLYYTSLLLGILAVLGLVSYGLLEWALINQLDTTLDTIAADVVEDVEAVVAQEQANPDEEENIQLAAYIPHLNTFRTPGVSVQIWEENHPEQPYSASIEIVDYTAPIDRSALWHEDAIRSEVVIDGVEVRVLTLPIRSGDEVIGNVQVGASMAQINLALNRLLRILSGGTLVAVVLSVLMGDWLARRALRPVASIVGAAQSISAADDLQQRIPYEGPAHDEMGRMVLAFNETLQRLERSFNSQKRFVADVSHELRTPLTTIQGNLDLLRLYDDPKSLQAIESEVQRMARLVGDLLLLAQADTGNLPMDFKPTELNRIMRDVYAEALLLSQEAHTVTFEDKTTQPLIVMGDGDRIKQVFLNLLVNALKYTPKHGQITLTLHQQGQEAIATIADTGIGIPQDDISHIFDRFYRVDKARARSAGGTGLGLSIARWIIEAHHGQIGIHSQVGVGTKFTVTFPLHTETPPETPLSRRRTEL